MVEVRLPFCHKLAIQVADQLAIYLSTDVRIEEELNSGPPRDSPASGQSGR